MMRVQGWEKRLADYFDLASWLQLMFEHSVSAINAYFAANSDFGSIVDFKNYCDSPTQFSDVFVCDGYLSIVTGKQIGRAHV